MSTKTNSPNTKPKRLKGKIRIGVLFEKGKLYKAGAIGLLALPTSQSGGYYFGVTVSKKRVVKAVDRNAIKRQMRAVIRLELEQLTDLKKGDYMLIFLANRKIDTAQLQKSYSELLAQLKF